MAKPSKAVLKFLETFKVDADEIWEVHGSTWVVKHKALERVAAEQGIIWDRPELSLCDPAGGLVVVLVCGRLKERVEYSYGEASPKNNKNAYPVAMAEKRGKDRVILKLLAAHGDLYSEEEADDFKRPNPHNTKPDDVFDQPEFDEHGQPIDNIPMADGVKALPKKDSRQTYKNLQTELQGYTDAAQLQAWAETIPDRVASLPADWAAIFRGQYKEHLAHLRSANGKAA